MAPKRVLSPCAGIVLLVAWGFAMATAQRTFVSAKGINNPSCSIAAPCRDFAAAISATNAGGEVIVLDSAGYGTVTITKSVSIVVPPGIYGGISVLSGDGVTINAPGATVVLRGLTINGQGGANGILVQQAARVRIEGCIVSNMGAVAIYHQAANGETIVLDTIVRDNRDGVGLVAADASIALERVRSEHNQNAGFYIAPSAPLRVTATIVDSTFSNNGTHGVWADTIGSALTVISVDRTTISDNGGDGFLASAGASFAIARATLARNTIRGNHDGIHALGPSPGEVWITASDNAIDANGLFGVDADGGGAVASVTGNRFDELACQNSGQLWSWGNNSTLVVNVLSPGCYSVLGNK